MFELLFPQSEARSEHDPEPDAAAQTLGGRPAAREQLADDLCAEAETEMELPDEWKSVTDFLPAVAVVVVVISVMSPVAMVAIWVIPVMMVSVPVGAVMSPVAVSTV